MKIEAFCVSCQKDTPHEIAVDRHNEVVMTCDCKHFIKTPKLSPEALRCFLDAHKKQNAGRTFLTPAQVIEQAKPDTYLESLTASGIAK